MLTRGDNAPRRCLTLDWDEVSKGGGQSGWQGRAQTVANHLGMRSNGTVGTGSGAGESAGGLAWSTLERARDRGRTTRNDGETDGVRRGEGWWS
jgi:hypothetical protein